MKSPSDPLRGGGWTLDQWGRPTDPSLGGGWTLEVNRAASTHARRAGPRACLSRAGLFFLAQVVRIRPGSPMVWVGSRGGAVGARGTRCISPPSRTGCAAATAKNGMPSAFAVAPVEPGRLFYSGFSIAVVSCRGRRRARSALSSSSQNAENRGAAAVPVRDETKCTTT